MEKLLSQNDINNIVGHKVNMVLYDQLKDLNNIDQLFPKWCNGCCLLLVRTTYNTGHWCGVIKKKNEITFFDPYGDFPDDQLEYTPIQYKPDLSSLLYNTSYDIEYNDQQLQNSGKNIATCGRWCALFFKYCKRMSVDDFSKIFKSYKKYIDLDLLVVHLTM